MPNTIVAIDVGTTKVCTLVGEITEQGRLRIVGVGVAPARGMRKGMVVNVEEATASIAASVEKAERISGYEIEGAFVGVAGEHIKCMNSRGVVAISRRDGGITQNDIDRATDAARAIAIPHNREIVHIIPRAYTVDDVDGVRDPLGMQAFRLEVETHIVTAAVPSLHNLVKCVNQAGVEVNELILESLASGEAVLTEPEREAGVVLVDVGGGTTDVAIFIDDSICYSLVLPVGGNHLTNDIAVGLRTPFSAAEEIKIKYGHALPTEVSRGETVDATVFGEYGRRPISRQKLAEIIQARAEEILDLILMEIKRSGYDGLLPAGLVLTGGTSALSGFKDLGREVLQLPVRVGAPHDLEGLIETISSPAYATSVGLLLWSLRRAPVSFKGNGRRGWPELFHNFNDWLKAFLPS
ncbi:MAG: cell division protein FtsA [Anaerolineae bacterium]